MYAALALSIAATFAVPAAVQAADQYIASIVVEGNEQVSADKIRRVIRLGRGDPYDRVKFQEALKRLFATKQFRYIQAYKDDVSSADSITVIVSVREYPKVEEVRYEGNKHVDHDDLEKVVGIGKGTFVRPSLLGKDRDAIADVYKEKGYYRVEVGDTISVDPELRARVLIYQIDEGEKVSVKHVDFIGVRALDTDEIRGMMKTKEDSWFRGGDFKPREFEEDQAEILRLYRGRGFLDARIVDKELVFSENGKDLDIFVTVEEGKQYEVGKVTWSGNELFPDTLISQMITMYEGEVFDDSEFARIRDDISSIYADRGYIYST
ncbi:MAG: hypothetical protein KAT30_03205, partial [Candidatus Krumholzibacteria bacterium]|nr:hypothetical protein [Candidatus Krumholzibacteria bacterium]